MVVAGGAGGCASSLGPVAAGPGDRVVVVGAISAPAVAAAAAALPVGLPVLPAAALPAVALAPILGGKTNRLVFLRQKSTTIEARWPGLSCARRPKGRCEGWEARDVGRG